MLYVTINKSQRPFRCHTTLVTTHEVMVMVQHLQIILDKIVSRLAVYCTYCKFCTFPFFSFSPLPI